MCEFRPFLDKSRFSFGKRKWNLSKKPSNSVCLPGMQGVCWIDSLTSILKIFSKLHLRQIFTVETRDFPEGLREGTSIRIASTQGLNGFSELYFHKSWWEEVITMFCTFVVGKAVV